MTTTEAIKILADIPLDQVPHILQTLSPPEQRDLVATALDLLVAGGGAPAGFSGRMISALRTEVERARDEGARSRLAGLLQKVSERPGELNALARYLIAVRATALRHAAILELWPATAEDGG
jgi:hypothetical protein